MFGLSRILWSKARLWAQFRRRRSSLFSGLVAAVLALCLFANAPLTAPPGNAMANAAQRAYEAALLQSQTGQANQEQVYRWSCRWLRAQLHSAKTTPERKKAFQNHLQRMKQLEEQGKKSVQAGLAPTSVHFALEFYCLEAAAWLQNMSMAPPQ